MVAVSFYFGLTFTIVLILGCICVLIMLAVLWAFWAAVCSLLVTMELRGNSLRSNVDHVYIVFKHMCVSCKHLIAYYIITIDAMNNFVRHRGGVPTAKPPEGT